MRLSTAAFVASPMIVEPKLELPMSNLPPPAPPAVPTPAARETPEREDSPWPVATPRISAVVALTMRASIVTVAFEDFVPTPPIPIPPMLTPPPEMPDVVVIAPELRDAADDDRVHAEDLRELRGGRRIGAAALLEVLLAHHGVDLLAFDHGVGAGADEVRDEHVGDPLADVHVGAEDVVDRTVDGAVVEVEDGDALLRRGLRAGGERGGEQGDKGERESFHGWAPGEDMTILPRTQGLLNVRPGTVRRRSVGAWR